MIVCLCGSTDLITLYDKTSNPKRKLQCKSCNSIITTKKKLVCDKCNSSKISKSVKFDYLECNDCGNTNIDTSVTTNPEDETCLTVDSDVIECNIRNNVKNQKLQDIVRIIRKNDRTINRGDNILEDYFSSIEAVIRSFPQPVTYYRTPSINHNEMIVQLSDLHLNEEINNECNKYNMEIASKRLYKYAQKICNYLKTGEFSTVYVVMTGDLINSDVRRDKLIQNATSNGNATVVGYQIISQFIEMLNKYANVVVTSVSGNEARLSIEKTYTAVSHTNNMDYVIFHYLKLHFKDSAGVTFDDPTNYEKVLTIKGTNVVLLHGDNNGTHSRHDIERCVTKYSISYKVIPDLIICGHLHETSIGDLWCRSGSLCGSDDYAKNGLQLTGKASQNIYMIYDNKDIDAIRVDLQNVNENDLKFNYSMNLIE